MTGRPLLWLRSIWTMVPGLCLSWCAMAQEPVSNWKSSSWQIGLGNTYLYDDYLSPLPHEGPSVCFSLSSVKGLNADHYASSGKEGVIGRDDILCDQGRWYSCPSLTFIPAYTQAKAGTVMYYANLDLRETLLRNLYCNPDWAVALGGYGALNGGLRYCAQNGNNPASADAMIDLGLAMSADYEFEALKRMIRIHYQASYALSGVAFSPEYAESYYEIFYLGNHENVVKWTNPFNMQRWSQQFCIDLPARNRHSSLRLSFNNNGRISSLNRLTVRCLNTDFTIGYIRYFSTL